MSTEPCLRVSPDLTLPLQAVTETFGILAVRRAGKSNAAVVVAEEMYDAGLPWVAIDPKGDWWGVRASGDGNSPGLAVLVFGGLHGDVPLEPTAGRLVADLVVEQRLTCVLDVSEMTRADQRRFLHDFADRLYRRNTEPLHVFCEEADEYIPQMVRGESAKVVGAFETLVKRGGFKGIGITLITQRSASLNKDVLTQVGSLIVLRTTSPQDQKAVQAWIQYHAEAAGTIAELPALGDGEAFLYSPAWLRTLQRFRFRQRRTFDSGATPKAGVKRRAPSTLAEVDLASIKEAMAATIEKAQADDPALLRRRIRNLENELAKAQEVTGNDHRIAALEGALSAIRFVLIDAAGSLTSIAAKIEALDVGPAPSAAADRPTPPVKAQPVPRASSLNPPPDGAGAPTHLRTGARRMVEALGRMHPLRLTTSQWGTLAHLKTTGGTWSTYLSDIRRAGFIDENAAGYTLTDAGFDYLGGQPEPMSPQELQDHYRGILRTGAVKMLDALIAAYPGGLTRDELGAAADIAVTGGTFSTYLSDLTRNGLAERNNGSVRATPILMGDTQ